MDLNLRPEKDCKFDAVSLGEVMLRLDPGEGRTREKDGSGRQGALGRGKAAENTM